MTSMLSVEAGVDAAVERLTAPIARGEVVVLSGAGISTESGIPDYRGPTGRARPATPMTIAEFLGTEQAQQRYWARSHVGWRSITGANPNDGHLAVADMQSAGLLAGVITQNVDGLHQAGGARDVTELHGSLDRVICVRCRQLSSRELLDDRLRAANPDFAETLSSTGAIKPDGDIDLDAEQIRRFAIVGCSDCDGPLKPDVVFFGENVPPERVAHCYSLVQRCRLLLVLGSSLTVASGFRFVRRAAILGIDVAIINQGPTRADALTEHRFGVPLGRTLNALAYRCGLR